MNNIARFFWAVFAGVIMLWVGGGTPVEGTSPEVCYEQVTKALIVKSTRTIVEVVDGQPVWSEPALWDGIAVVDDGRARGPLPHNNVTPGTVGYREYWYTAIDYITLDGDEIPCPTTTTSTTSTTTTTTTTATTPPTSAPTTPPAEIVDECWIDNNPETVIASGQFVLYDLGSDDGVVGSHSRSGMPCGPAPAPTLAPVEPGTSAAVAPAAGQTLPATGSGRWEVLLVGGLLVLLGFILVRARRW